MWTYIGILAPSWSEPLYDTSSSSDITADGAKRDFMLSVLRGVMLLCTIGNSSSIGRTPAMAAFQLALNKNGTVDGSTTATTPNKTGLQKKSRGMVERNQIRRFIFASAVCPILYRLLVWAGNHHDNTYRRFDLQNNGDTDDNDDGFERDRRSRENIVVGVGGREEEERSSYCRRRAIERRKMVLGGLTRLVACVVPPLELYYHLMYVMKLRRTGVNGFVEVGSSPTLAMNWAGLHFVRGVSSHSGDASDPSGNNNGSFVSPSTNSTTGTITASPPQIFYDYAHRRVLLEEVIATANMVVPLDSWRSMTGVIVRSWNRRRTRLVNYINSMMHNMSARGVHDNDDSRQISGQSSRNPECPICYKKSIRVPYVTSCGHVYCYACLRQAVSDSIGGTNTYTCHVCSSKVFSSDRFYHNNE